MKRILSLFAVVCLMVLSACHPEPILSVNPDSLSFTESGGSQTVQISANYAWTASVSGSGFSVSPTSGEGSATVTVTASAASSPDEASGSLSVWSEGLSASVSLSQSAKLTLILGDGVKVPASGGSIEIPVQYNTDYTVEVESSARSWIKFIRTKALSSGKLEFEISVNDGDERSGKVTVKDNSGKASPVTVTITQEGETKVLVVGDAATVPAEGATVEVDVQYNVDYTVEVESSAQSWIHYVETKTVQNGKLVFKVDANDGDERSGKVTLKDKSGKVAPVTVTFVQERRIAVESVTLDKDSAEIEIGTYLQLTATVAPENAADKTVTWSSDKPGIASVDDHGLVTGVAEGTATITAKAGEQIATCTVSVIAPTSVIEREALIALYNALDGDHWLNNENWCSEKPLNEWFGIKTDEEGHIIELIIPFDNNAKGDIPQAIAQLNHLKRLELSGMVISGVLPYDVFKITSLEWLNINCWKMEPVNLKGIGALKKLKYLYLNKVSGDIPEEIGLLTELKTLALRSSGLVGTLPESIGNLKALINLDLSNNSIRGDIPASIGELSVLRSLHLQGNRLSGSIPDELGNLSFLTDLNLSGNLLSGTIPESVQQLSCWPLNCWYCIYDNLFRPEEVMGALSVPSFSVTCLNGYQYDSKTEFKKNQFTLLHKTSNEINDEVLNSIKTVYDKYHSKGLNCLTYVSDDFGVDFAWMEDYISTRGIEWPSFLSTRENCIYPSERPSATDFPVLYISPTCVIVNSEGKVVSYSFGSSEECIAYLESYFGGDAGNTLYTSSDYSMDGHVSVLQSCDTGSGIDLVLMGDAFSDRQIVNGYYSSVMSNAMELFFSVEPYKSFQNLFNVYIVDIVSPNEGYDDGCKPALGTWISDNSFIGGLKDKKVFNYALNAITPERLDDALIVVMMNAEKYGGVAALYENHRYDYGSGTGVAYVPLGRHQEERKYLLMHEAGGHAFSKLADEYSYPGRVTEDFVYNHQAQEIFGFWKNIDFTSDPQSVKWARFLVDEKYAGEGIGLFEGSCGFSEGVWRPSENSIMRSNSYEFNAPSRYAIWYRIGKLAYGEDWGGTYEDFVAYDKINRTSAGVSDVMRHHRNSVEMPLPQLPPPIVTGHSWRE